MSFLTLTTLITILLSLALAFKLLFQARANRFVNRFLGFCFLIFAYRSLAITLLREDMIQDNFIMGSGSFAYYWTPVCMYFYIRTLVNDEQSLRRKDLVHFILPLGALLLAVFYLLRGLVMEGRLVIPEQQPVWQPMHNPWQLSPLLHWIVPTTLGIIYMVLAGKHVYGKFFKGQPVLHPQAIKIRNWICLLFAPTTVMLLLVVFGQLAVRLIGYPEREFFAINLLRCLLFLFVLFQIIRNRELLFGLPDIATSLPAISDKKAPDGQLFDAATALTIAPCNKKNDDTEHILQEQEAGYDQMYYDEYGWMHLHCLDEHLPKGGQPPIEKDRAVAYITRINDYLKTDPDLGAGFSLQTMGGAMAIPVHHLEYLFRYYNKYTFSEFRNQLRVKYVLRCFEQGLWKDYTIEALGEKAGFSSRATFFRVFKNATGKSPGAYIASS